MKLTKREKVLLLILCVVIVVGGYYTLFYKNFSAQTATVKQNITDLNLTVNEQLNKQSQVDNLEKAVADVKEEVEYYSENHLAPDYDFYNTLMDIDKILVANGAKQISITPYEQIQDEYYNTVDIAISLEIEYEKVEALVESIEKSQYIQHITNLSVDGSSNTAENSMANVNLTYTIFFNGTEQK